MDYVIGWMRIKPGQRSAFASASMEFVTATRAEPGVVFFELLPSQDDPDVLVAIECYESSEAHNAHVQSLHFAAFWHLFQSHVVEGRFENLTGSTPRMDVVRPLELKGHGASEYQALD